MIADEIRELLDSEPFEPFRLRLSSGDHYAVRDSRSVALLRSRLFIALPDGDHWVFVPYLHIAAVEALNGRNGFHRRKRRG